jgi:hypothetical protein
MVALWIGMAELAGAQTVAVQPATSNEHHAAEIATFLGGAALGLSAHESGHLLFDVIFDAHPGLKKVSFLGVPFFAITHDPGLSPRKEFVISSAGFWVQHAGSEWILTKRPGLRHEYAPALKGLLAFNVLASVAYGGVALARAGPIERDTHGMAASLRWKEPLIGAVLLVPAVLDGFRYYRPGAKWAAWTSRGAKVGMVLLVLKR